MKDTNPNQIIRFDGKNCFMEIMKNAFSIGKVNMNFIEYDLTQKKNNRIKQNISIYMNIDEFLALYRDIISGKLLREAENSKQKANDNGYKYCVEIFKDMGGVSASKLKERGKERADKKSFSRQFKITPGVKTPWILSAECGPGEENETGLIVPKYINKKPEQIIRIPLQHKDLKKFAEVTYTRIVAYFSSLENEEKFNSLEKEILTTKELVSRLLKVEEANASKLSQIFNMLKK